MKPYHRIEISLNIMFGKPVIKNTRITVEHVLRKLAAGMSVEKIIAHHPHLKTEDIFAAHEFAADYLANEEIAFAQERIN